MEWRPDVLHSYRTLRCGQGLCEPCNHLVGSCANCGAPSVRCVYPEDVAFCHDCLTDGPEWIVAVLLEEIVGVPA